MILLQNRYFSIDQIPEIYRRTMLTKRQRTGRDLSNWIKTITTQDFFADKVPRELCLVVSLLSKGHRESLKEAKRSLNVQYVDDVVQSMSLLNEIKYLSPSLGLPWPPPGATKAAVRADQVHVLELAIAQDCPLEVGGMQGCWLLAVKHGSVAVMAWLREHHPNECRWDQKTSKHAAIHGQVASLQWLRAQNPPCPWNEYLCEFAAGKGHIPVLKWARMVASPPCPWNEWTCARAAHKGQLAVLKWVRAQDPPCPWDLWACAEAAKSGHLQVLKWLRAQKLPCPWGREVYAYAVRGSKWEVVKWMRAQNPPCPWYASTETEIKTHEARERNDE